MLDPVAERFLGIAQVEERYSLERSTIWRRLKAKKFPVPVYLNGRRHWRLSELLRWESENLAGGPRAA